MTIAWVVGAGGLLGSALHSSLARTGTHLFLPTQRFDWENESVVKMQLDAAVRAFAAAAESTPGGWQIHWAAGLGTMGSSAASLQRETRLLETLLTSARSRPTLAGAPGTLLLASSAGGIYAGSEADIITEQTTVAPTTDYARGKLEHERLLKEFVDTHESARAVVARIATLYGPSRPLKRHHGLITEMARRIIRNQPVNIFVPLDTIRDYIAVEDAADAIVALARAAPAAAGTFTRIVASEQTTTISEVVAVFKRIAHRMPRIITSGCDLSALYRRRIQFRSIHPLPDSGRVRTSLAVGIARVMAAERLTFARHGA